MHALQDNTNQVQSTMVYADIGPLSHNASSTPGPATLRPGDGERIEYSKINFNAPRPPKPKKLQNPVDSMEEQPLAIGT